ncbi:hypothetical protein OAO58_01645, partial [bacterium]|nr:hypothetical protein [bacterium]
ATTSKLLTSDNFFREITENGFFGLKIDKSPLIELADDPDALLDELDLKLTWGEMSAQTRECYLINTLTGPLVSTGNDQVILKVGTIPQVIIREGDFLPTISHTAKIGSSLEESTLNLDPAGNLYFTAQLTANSTHLMTLFRAEGRVIYKVLSEGDSIEIRDGSSADIASFTGLLPSGDDDGFPSSSMENSLALSVISSSDNLA